MRFLNDIINLFFPEICLNCEQQLGSNETIICTSCRHDMPLTNFTGEINNKVEQVFYGRISIKEATSLMYYYKKNKVQKIIHSLKYKGHQEIGAFFGEWLVKEMLQSDRFNNIDMIVPVPLHPKKLKKRGYNQVSIFGKTLATYLNANYCEDILIRKSATSTQTKKHRLERWKNVEELFFLTDNSYFEGKNILLIDDVITTGATLEACANELSKTSNINISIATMAFTA